VLTRRLWLGLGWLQTLGLVVLCLLPLTALPGHEIPWSDKIYHCASFALLMWWFTVAQPRTQWRRTGLLLILLGTAIEFAQGFVPLRSPSLADALADVGGVLLGAFVAHLTPTRLPAWRPTA